MKNYIILSILLFLCLSGKGGTPQDLKGDLYLNLTFIKVGESQNGYVLEQAIYNGKKYINEVFKGHKIHFVSEHTMILMDDASNLQDKWMNNTLPEFDDRLTIYVFPGQDSSADHQYLLRPIFGESALIPFYNQNEFNHFLLKNIKLMLGLPIEDNFAVSGLAELTSSKNYPSNRILKFRSIKITPSVKNSGKRKRGFDKKSSAPLSNNLFEEYITEDQGLAIHENIDGMPHLRAKRYKIDHNESHPLRNIPTLVDE